MSKEYLVNAYLRRSNKNKQSRTKVACFSNFKMYHDFPVSILNLPTCDVTNYIAVFIKNVFTHKIFNGCQIVYISRNNYHFLIG